MNDDERIMSQMWFKKSILENLVIFKLFEICKDTIKYFVLYIILITWIRTLIELAIIHKYKLIVFDAIIVILNIDKHKLATYILVYVFYNILFYGPKLLFVTFLKLRLEITAVDSWNIY